ncbi:hypothetical protein OBBRIDRAFT_514563 [Obba rivulosa]|uniref:Uncharacterized protein n=1 Tax=Obba rivulosa TaxID=1052685 RepID=A0A8E2AVD3_9APHY|nr:hypothetical protein OBBRIDRAFT_514563 [Obba rivulosa]
MGQNQSTYLLVSDDEYDKLVEQVLAAKHPEQNSGMGGEPVTTPHDTPPTVQAILTNEHDNNDINHDPISLMPPPFTQGALNPPHVTAPQYQDYATQAISQYVEHTILDDIVSTHPPTVPSASYHPARRSSTYHQAPDGYSPPPAPRIPHRITAEEARARRHYATSPPNRATRYTSSVSGPYYSPPPPIIYNITYTRPHTSGMHSNNMQQDVNHQNRPNRHAGPPPLRRKRAAALPLRQGTLPPHPPRASSSPPVPPHSQFAPPAPPVTSPPEPVYATSHSQVAAAAHLEEARRTPPHPVEGEIADRRQSVANPPILPENLKKKVREIKRGSSTGRPYGSKAEASGLRVPNSAIAKQFEIERREEIRDQASTPKKPWDPAWETFPLVCFRGPRREIILIERTWDDKRLMEELRRHYDILRGTRRKWLSIKNIRGVRTVQTTKDYIYPVLADITTNAEEAMPGPHRNMRFREYLKNPGQLEGDHDFMRSFTQNVYHGVEFIERWQVSRIVIVIAVPLTVSLIVAISYAIGTGDVSSAFTIAGKFFAAVPIFCGSLLFFAQAI